ncbi:MAG TPA: hypothetical protein DCF65_14205 [Chloroflexi bacterium]|jgi:uncharacterized membrane protein|nr:hypothetical protein [Chloroflexota bacterium]HAF19815.1 hypothetical protein [Chloroflexota bacterium]
MAQPSTQAPVSLGADDKARVVHRLRRVHRAPATDHKHPVNQAHYEDSTFGERLADRAAAVIGSWPFIISQTALMVLWVYVNVWAIFIQHWDPYPFIFLNLVLSFQATYAGPIVLLAGNRQSQKDRITLEHAADESDKGEQHITKILIEIKKNTELTLQILRELEAEGG